MAETRNMRVYMYVGNRVTNPFQFVLPFDGRRTAVAPKIIRRCVRRVHMDPMPDGTYVFRARSFSRRRGQVYRCRVNPNSGYVWCSCKDFIYRHSQESPSYWGGHVCKHLQRAIRTVRKVEREHAHDLPLAA